MPTWGLVLAGYAPSAVVVAVILLQKEKVDYPDDFDLGNPWDDISGIDML